MRSGIRWTGAGLFSLVLSGLAWAEGDQFAAPTITAVPTIDGVITPGEWSGALYLDKFTDQQTGQVTADKTEAWIGVTEAGVYVAIYAHDAQPDKIVARAIQKGGDITGDDYAGLIIDPMNRKAFSGNSQFFVTSIGTQFENIAGGRAAKKEWRGTWLSETSRVADGYVIEMMVPWRLLSYPAGRKSDILFNVARLQERTKTASYAVDVGRPFRVENHGYLLGVQFPKRDVSEQLDLLGYVSPEYDEDEDPSSSVRAGFDIRYRPTETLSSVLSFNPDFKNIEGEVAGIEFTRSERFLGDVRPFFTEGSRYFELTSGFGFGQMFYSNRIDDFDQGFKFFGDFDKRKRMGFLVAREDGNRLDSVANFEYKLGVRAGVSVFGTYRDEPQRKNSVFGATGDYGTGNHSFGFEMAQSDDGGQRGSVGRVYADYEVPNYFATATGYFVQPEFRARLGYVPFVDKTGGYLFHEYNREYREGWLRSVHAENYIEDFDHMDGRNFQRGLSGGLSIQTRSDWRYGLNYSRDTFEDEVSETYTVSSTWNVSNRFKRLGFGYNWGDQGGQHTSFLSVDGSVRIGRGLDLGLSQSVFRLGDRTEQTVVSLGWEIDPEQSFSGRYVKTDRDSNWYVAYRKSGGLGLEYFVIFGDPNAREFRNRAAFKVVWAR